MPANVSDVQLVFLQKKIKQLAQQMIKNSKQEAYTFLEMLTSVPENVQTTIWERNFLILSIWI